MENILETLFSGREEQSSIGPKTERHRKGQKYYYIKYEMTWVEEVEQRYLSRLYCSGYYHNCWGIVETGR